MPPKKNVPMMPKQSRMVDTKPLIFGPRTLNVSGHHHSAKAEHLNLLKIVDGSFDRATFDQSFG